MNKLNILTIALGVLSVIVATGSKSFGQKDDILRRLKAEEIKSNIYLHILNKEVYYLHDVEDQNRTSAGFLIPESAKLLWTSKSKKLRLSIGFYNPYQYSVTVTSALTDDPISQTTEELFAALTGMLSIITTGTPIGTLTGAPAGVATVGLDNAALIAKAARVVNTSAGPVSLEPKDLDQFRSPTMIEWSMWIRSQQVRGCHLNQIQIDSIVASVANIEVLLYQKFLIEDDKLTFQSHVKKVTHDLYIPEDIDSLVSSLELARKTYKGLTRHIREARKNMDNIKIINNAFIIDNTSDCNIFRLYHQMIFAQYLAEVDEKLKKLDKIMATMNDLVKVGETFLKRNKVYLFNGQEKETIYNKEIDVEDDKITTVVLEVKHQEIDQNDSTVLTIKKELTRVFELTKFRRAWPEISSGIFYSDIEYNAFSAGESTAPLGGGATTSSIVQTTNNQRFMAAIFYNQVFDTRLHPMYPFLQIGVGTGRDYPCLLAGGGFRIINKDLKRLSISGGWVFPFTKELDKLKVGDAISGGQAQIDDDVKYRLGERVGFYIGVAWKFN